MICPTGLQIVGHLETLELHWHLLNPDLDLGLARCPLLLKGERNLSQPLLLKGPLYIIGAGRGN